MCAKNYETSLTAVIYCSIPQLVLVFAISNVTNYFATGGYDAHFVV